MTEAEWQAWKVAEPVVVLTRVRGLVSDRKLRLLLCGCARALPDLDVPPDLPTILEFAEGFADGLLTLDALNSFRSQRTITSPGATTDCIKRRCSATVLCARKALWQSCVELCGQTVRYRIAAIAGKGWEKQKTERHQRLSNERPHIVALILDVVASDLFGITLNPTWLTSTVAALANGIYAERAFDRMPILADALQDAGCENEDVLNHCRGDGPHVKGCWVVDLLLGKS